MHVGTYPSMHYLPCESMVQASFLQTNTWLIPNIWHPYSTSEFWMCVTAPQITKHTPYCPFPHTNLFFFFSNLTQHLHADLREWFLSMYLACERKLRADVWETCIPHLVKPLALCLPSSLWSTDGLWVCSKGVLRKASDSCLIPVCWDSVLSSKTF